MKLDVALPYFVTEPKQFHEVVRALDSVSKNVNKIWAIDGRYKEFTHDRDYSIDGVNGSLINRYPNIEIIKLCANQQEKRQAYLDASDAEYLLVLDSDDYVHYGYSNWNKFYGELQEVYDEPELLYFLWYYVDPEWNTNNNPVTPNTWQKWIRIHKHPSKQKYYMNHYTWRLKEDNSVNLNSLKAKKTLSGIKLTADSKYRSEDFKQRSAEWVKKNWEIEQGKAWVAFNKLEALSNVVFPKK